MTDTEQLKTNSNYVPHFLEKFAFGMGDFWTSIAYNAMATYLTMFYTDIVGISAGTAAMILLSVRFIIAVWDLIVGVLVDRSYQVQRRQSTALGPQSWHFVWHQFHFAVHQSVCWVKFSDGRCLRLWDLLCR